jgi:hypothetical protein
MSAGRSENSEEEDETLAQQLQILDASVWADGLEGQPRKKGKSDGRLTSRFVWTDAVSAVV